jgi:deazaflavin-dependent oxidoreductase (nitroreductase family)
MMAGPEGTVVVVVVDVVVVVVMEVVDVDVGAAVVAAVSPPLQEATTSAIASAAARTVRIGASLSDQAIHRPAAGGSKLPADALERNEPLGGGPMVSDWSRRNLRLIEEFRANRGRVGGRWEGRPLLLLHHRGARTGTQRVSPLMYRDADGGYAIFASKGGADTNPDWFHNLMANPDTEVEVGPDTVQVHARLAEGEEYEELWTAQKRDWPFFAEYERKTARDHIPVVVLERR